MHSLHCQLATVQLLVCHLVTIRFDWFLRENAGCQNPNSVLGPIRVISRAGRQILLVSSEAEVTRGRVLGKIMLYQLALAFFLLREDGVAKQFKNNNYW